MKKEIKFSIVIPTLNEEKIIAATLKKLKAGLRDFRYQYEIIVADGGSSDDTLGLARTYADRIVQEDKSKPSGIARGKNTGGAAAKGEYFVFIDADVEIPEPKHFFLEALSQFETRTNLVGLTVPLKVHPALGTIGDRIFFPLLAALYVLFNNILHIGNASGEFQMIRAQSFKALGGYAEHLITGEDNDMFLRLSKIGRTLIYTPLFVLHTGRRAHAIGWPKLLYQWTISGVSVFLFKRSPHKKWDVIR